jgi:hypothetical protein
MDMIYDVHDGVGGVCLTVPEHAVALLSMVVEKIEDTNKACPQDDVF